MRTLNYLFLSMGYLLFLDKKTKVLVSTLECANHSFDKNIMDKMIAMAVKIDKQ
jgi:hypothetical protein